MPSTYSNLKIELIGTGEQAGTWGLTTNNNLQYAIEEAITGSSDVTFTNADVTLTFLNSNLPQIPRNLRLNLIGVASTPLNLIVPNLEKFYLINNTLSNTITIKNATGTGVAIEAGKSLFVFNDGVNISEAINSLGAPLAISSGGTGQSSGTGSGLPVFQTSPTLTTPNIDTPSAGTLTNCTGLPMTTGVTGILPIGNGGTNTTTTPIQGGVSYGTGTAYAFTAAGTSGQILKSNGFSAPSWIAAPGTIYTQNASSVSITGGSITGITDLAVADGGTGSSTLAANNVLLGNGTSALQTVAPGASGNVLKSNGTTWTSGAGFVWNVQNVNTVVANGVTGSYTIPANCIMVLGTSYSSMGGNTGSQISVNIKNSAGTILFTYILTGGNENNGGDGGSGMSSRSAWTVAIPTAAIGGTLEFFRSSGSNGSYSVTVNQYVANA